MIGGIYHVRLDADTWVPSSVQMPAPVFDMPVMAGCWACREYMGRDQPRRHCLARVVLAPPVDGLHFLARSPRWSLLVDGGFADWPRWDRMKPIRELTISEYRAALATMRRGATMESPYF